VQQYSVDIRSYARARAAAGDSTFAKNMALCKKPIEQICNRYQLRGKHVLSLGTGDGFEECWMAPANRLTMVDISDSVAAFKEAARGTGTPADRYFVADAHDFIGQCQETFEVLYVSSFHPDELRREAIQTDFRKMRSPDEADNYITWKAGTPAYHHIIEDALDLVKPDGLIILQHYRGGIDITANPQYVDDIVWQFARHGVHLVELHHFRESPMHLLVTARRCSKAGIQQFRSWLKGRPPITTFHGRYDNPLNQDILRIEEPVGTSQARAGARSRPTLHRRWQSLLHPIASLRQRR
jgi:hypothetical protein